MAYARRSRRPGKRARPKRAHRAGQRVRVKSHTRTPRGPNQGKRPVRVLGYTRHMPRPH
jgi:hypothetical protein